MPWWEIVVIAVAGLWAGTINTVVGSGTLVTFPVLVALGFPPVTATTSNAIGLVTGSITGAYGYRHEVREARVR
ncbi:MAG TPA: TSUP family transporter, partial [Pseudonocardia sp.]|nr:TSUP family transporter [Pseudonocardia sp.]